MKAINILWDVDCPAELNDLPAEVQLPPDLEDEEAISDYLSDTTGFCHKGFQLVHENTGINYLYRDASNYKVYNSCVIKGALTEEQKTTILAALKDGEFFIPHIVGLPERKFGTETIDDHPFFVLTADDFEPTDEPPTLDITCEELSERFAAAAINGAFDV